MKNVLYLSYDGMTDPLGQSQVLPYLKELSREEFRFTILSFEKPARLAREGATIRKICAESGIDWVPLTFTSKPPVLSKIYDRYRMKRTALKLHRKKKFSLLHCRSYVAAEIGLLFKRKLGIPFLFDMRGFWADEKVDNGQWDLRKPLYKRIYYHYKKKEREFLLEAAGIVSLTQAGKDYLLSQEGYEGLSIDVIPCCADLGHFDFHKVDDKAKTSMRAKLGLDEGAKLLVYLGSVGGWYMTNEMFHFFRLLRKQDPSWQMLLLTKDEPERVRAEAAALGIPPAALHITYSTRSELPVYLGISTASIFFIRNTFSKTASSPTKHAELMGMGIPVVCNDIGDTGRIIEATGTGLLVNEFGATAMQQAVGRMPELVLMQPEPIRQAAFRYFDLHRGASDYLGIYQRILSLPSMQHG